LEIRKYQGLVNNGEGLKRVSDSILDVHNLREEMNNLEGNEWPQ